MHPNILSKKNLAERIVIVARVIEDFANRHILEPSGLSMSSFEIMYVINEHKTITPTMILGCRGGTKSNISQRLNFLEKHDYIKRVYAKNKKDKREVLVKLTTLGQKKLSEVGNLLSQKTILLENLFEKSEVKKHLDFLEKIFNALIEQEEKINPIQGNKNLQ